jgi:deoxycytidylate deaminase
MEGIKTYADAIYQVKRGFLIIGLTGYTGSGCTTAMNILSSETKPILPDYEAIKGFADPNIDSRRYKRLRNVWESLGWKRFVPIEVAPVIFALAVYRAINSKEEDEILAKVRGVVKDDVDELVGLQYLYSGTERTEETAMLLIKAYEKCRGLYGRFKKVSTGNLGEFIELMQNLGDQIRKFGNVSPENGAVPQPANVFVLPEAIRRLIRAYRLTKQESHFVIDAFRNPYEVEYFKRRYSEFYLVGILRNPRDRVNSLTRSLGEDSAKKVEQRERGKIIKERNKDNIAQWVTSQNIEEILQKVDVYMKNIDGPKSYPQLRFNLAKLIALVKEPGCITPTIDERSMQIAMTARQMSGCISRQVGAVVVNIDGYVLGVGWNDPPTGQIPCEMRTGRELVDSPTKEVFSEYERSEEFVRHIQQHCYEDLPFCFRTEYAQISKGKMAEFTRALHAEENALIQSVRNTEWGLKGSVLYTTASPCTLCAKKAYQLGVDRIVFVEEYPGIALEQTLKAGARDIQIDQFEGIVGGAYFQLFSSLLPEKDLIQLYLPLSEEAPT